MISADIDAAKIDAIFAASDRPDTPGCALGVFRAGEVLYAKGYGQADLERPAPITSRSVFDVGSTSKQFTAASILLLAMDGKLDLEADIRTLLPQLPDLGGPIRVRHLVHHTSGIRDYLNLIVMSGRNLDNDYTEDEIVDLLARQRGLDFPPGTKHSYSNSGYFLLSEIVRLVSGKSLREFAHERIFGPLGMTQTFFHDDYAELVPGRAIGYTPGPEGTFRIDVPIGDVLGDGAVFTTVEDLARWDARHYEGDEFVRRLTTPGTLDDGTALEYAFGLMIGDYRGQRTVHHGGAWGGYRAQMTRFPDQRLTIAVLANHALADPTGLAHQVADVLLDDVLEPARGKVAGEPERPADVSGLTGVYVDADATMAVDVAQEEGKAVLRLGGRTFALLALAGGAMRVAGLPVDLEPVAEGLSLSIHGDERFQLTRVSGETESPDELAGRYRSDELDATYELRLGAAGLEVRCGYQPWQPLTPAGADRYALPSGVITLQRGGGRTEGFRIGSGRARGLRFMRVS